MLDEIRRFTFMRKDRPTVVMLYANDVYRQFALQNLCWLQVCVWRRTLLK
jgi:hypothetical protein